MNESKVISPEVQKVIDDRAAAASAVAVARNMTIPEAYEVVDDFIEEAEQKGVSFATLCYDITQLKKTKKTSSVKQVDQTPKTPEGTEK
jgi:hypothetical protein